MGGFDGEADKAERDGVPAEEVARIRAAAALKPGSRVRIVKSHDLSLCRHVGRIGTVRRVVPQYGMVYVDLEASRRGKPRINEPFSARTIEIMEPEATCTSATAGSTTATSTP